MRNLLEKTYFCNDCGVEVDARHQHGHNVRFIPVCQIPWNARREWLDEVHESAEQTFFFDEE
jgi:hypothetical protein